MARLACTASPGSGVFQRKSRAASWRHGAFVEIGFGMVVLRFMLSGAGNGRAEGPTGIKLRSRFAFLVRRGLESSHQGGRAFADDLVALNQRLFAVFDVLADNG